MFVISKDDHPIQFLCSMLHIQEYTVKLPYLEWRYSQISCAMFLTWSYIWMVPRISIIISSKIKWEIASSSYPILCYNVIPEMESIILCSVQRSYQERHPGPPFFNVKGQTVNKIQALHSFMVKGHVQDGFQHHNNCMVQRHTLNGFKDLHNLPTSRIKFFGG